MIEYLKMVFGYHSREVACLSKEYQELRDSIAKGKKQHGRYEHHQKRLTLVTGRLIELGY